MRTGKCPFSHVHSQYWKSSSFLETLALIHYMPIIYGVLHSVIYINIFEFRRNTTFDANFDELALDKMSLDELG